MQVSDEELDCVWRMIAAILHLGNTIVKEDPENEKAILVSSYHICTLRLYCGRKSNDNVFSRLIMYSGPSYFTRHYTLFLAQIVLLI